MNPQLEELACLYVLDRLEPRERASFEALLSKDPVLAERVRELEAAVARCVRALPQHAPPQDLLARIEARIDALPSAASARARAERSSSLFAAIARWGIAAVVAVSLSAIAVQLWRGDSAGAGRPVVVIVTLDPNESRLAELRLNGRPSDADARLIQLASLADGYWDRPDTLPVKSPPDAAGTHGYAVFDPATRQGFIAVRHLPPLAKGQRYCLWILDTATGRVGEAGSLPESGARSGLYSFSVDSGLEGQARRIGFAVTVEDSGRPGPAKPSGRVVLGDVHAL